MTNRGYSHLEGTDTFVSNVSIPDYPIDTDEKREAVVDFIDTICPDSDDAYPWDSDIMRQRHERYVQLMYLAKDGLEHAAEEIKKLRARLAEIEALRPLVGRWREADDAWQFGEGTEGAVIEIEGEIVEAARDLFPPNSTATRTDEAQR